MPYWEITFSGKNSEDIQGIQLREAIRKIGSKMNLIGRVKNLKNSGKVQVLLKVENVQLMEKFCNVIISNEHPLIHGKIDEIIVKRKISYDPEPTWKEFKIQRDGELVEMVWALQGAGKLIAQQEENRENTRKAGLLYNLNVISDLTSQMISDKASYQKFILIAVENYVKEASQNESEFIFQIYQLLQLCNQFNTNQDSELMQAGIKKGAMKDILNQILNTSNDLTGILQKNKNNENEYK